MFAQLLADSKSLAPTCTKVTDDDAIALDHTPAVTPPAPTASGRESSPWLFAGGILAQDERRESSQSARRASEAEAGVDAHVPSFAGRGMSDTPRSLDLGGDALGAMPMPSPKKSLLPERAVSGLYCMHTEPGATTTRSYGDEVLARDNGTWGFAYPSHSQTSQSAHAASDADGPLKGASGAARGQGQYIVKIAAGAIGLGKGWTTRAPLVRSSDGSPRKRMGGRLWDEYESMQQKGTKLDIGDLEVNPKP